MADEKTIGTENMSITPERTSETSAENVLTVPSEQIDTHIEGSSEQKERKYDEILAQVAPESQSSVPSDNTDHQLDAKSISATIDEESKVQKLIELAETRGVVYAVKVARSLGDYYALDKMHDELVDNLYEGLLAKGLIKKD
ncbi:MAG: hypothetical protein PHH40_02965 [Candidatus Moranbacteria bacterium]|nr:hypothetical protein [Candidatus Moranbacteria bacterium]MDD3965152.1 hypothetical protein [Candidatus Moranbacteria bacterium]